GLAGVVRAASRSDQAHPESAVRRRTAGVAQPRRLVREPPTPQLRPRSTPPERRTRGVAAFPDRCAAATEGSHTASAREDGDEPGPRHGGSRAGGSTSRSLVPCAHYGTASPTTARARRRRRSAALTRVRRTRA